MLEHKNRLAIFTPAISRNAGGISNTAYYLAREFSKRCSVTVFSSLHDNEALSCVTLVMNSSNNSKKSIFRNLLEFRKYLAKSKKNDVRVIAMSWRSAIIPYLLRRRFNRKYIILCHGDEVLPNTSKKKALETILRKKIMSCAAVLCCNSNYTANLVRSITSKPEIKIVHPCQGEILQRGICDERFILSIGRLERRKGFQDVIFAVDSMKEKYPQMKYCIAGEGSYRDELEKKIRERNLENNCILLGRVSEEQKEQLLSSCTLLALPSFFDDTGSVEGFGIVLLEANAHGKPVIGSYSGGIPDAIINGKTGILVHEKKVDELARAIEMIWTGSFKYDRDLGFEWAEKHSYANIIKKYADIIASI